MTNHFISALNFLYYCLLLLMILQQQREWMHSALLGGGFTARCEISQWWLALHSIIILWKVQLALGLSNKSNDLWKLFAGTDARVHIFMCISCYDRAQEVRAVGESEGSSWTLYHCALIVSLTILSGGGAGVEQEASKPMVFQQVHIWSTLLS